MHQRRWLFDKPHSLYEAALMGAVILLAVVDGIRACVVALGY
jgi:hypothetical protein